MKVARLRSSSGRNAKPPRGEGLIYRADCKALSRVRVYGAMLREREQIEIARLWERKLWQDALNSSICCMLRLVVFWLRIM